MVRLLAFGAVSLALIAGSVLWVKPRLVRLIDTKITQPLVAIAQANDRRAEALSVEIDRLKALQQELRRPLPIRASDLSAGSVMIDGMRGQVNEGRGAEVGVYPVRFLSNIPGAQQMRLGNTREELALADWQSYSPEVQWFVRSGHGRRTVYAEFRREGDVTKTQALVPNFDNSLGTDYVFPVYEGNRLDVYDEAAPIWSQDFSDGFGRWVSYDYHGGVHQSQNTFYPASWHEDGYIWTDASRWRIDTPETPHSILALLVYPKWLAIDERAHTLDLNGATVRIDVDASQLDLKGGTAHLFVNSRGGRWHSQEPLELGDDWTTNEIDVDSAEWFRSWDDTSEGSDGQPQLGEVYSFGVKFIGFPHGIEPTGVLKLDNVVID